MMCGSIRVGSRLETHACLKDELLLNLQTTTKQPLLNQHHLHHLHPHPHPNPRPCLRRQIACLHSLQPLRRCHRCHCCSTPSVMLPTRIAAADVSLHPSASHLLRLAPVLEMICQEAALGAQPGSRRRPTKKRKKQRERKRKAEREGEEALFSTAKIDSKIKIKVQWSTQVQ